MSGTVYIVLFRGVGGKTQLPTRPLREKLTEAGFDNVATYINSGNALVKSDLARAKVVARIAEICAQEFGFDKAVYAITRAEWASIIANTRQTASAGRSSRRNSTGVSACPTRRATGTR